MKKIYEKVFSFKFEQNKIKNWTKISANSNKNAHISKMNKKLFETRQIFKGKSNGFLV
jgi:hypothetical protein